MASMSGLRDGSGVLLEEAREAVPDADGCADAGIEGHARSACRFS